MKKINTNLIFIVLTTILLFVSTLIPLEYDYYYKYIQIAGYAITLAYFIIRLIQKKPIKIINNKLDLCVILLAISTIIPLIVNTYVSLYGSVKVILQYMYALSIYFLLREITNEKTGLGKIITNGLIIITVLSIFIGIDGITFYNTEGLLKKLKITLSMNGDNRVVSTFGCANPFAVFISSILFLNLNEETNQKKRPLKALYKTITYIFMVGIILTYSKTMFVILIPVMILYIILIKEKNKKIEVIENLLISAVMSLMFIMTFDTLFNQGAYLLIWIILGILIGLDYLINLIFERLNDECIYNWDFKRIFTILGIIILIGVIYIVIGLKIYDKYIVFAPNIPSDYEVKIINYIKGNTKYKLDFDIISNTEEGSQSQYTIKIFEKDSKNQEIKEHNISFGNYIGIKTFEILTQEETSEFRVEFYMDEEVKGGLLIVNSLNINDKVYPLKYKILPTKLVEKIKSINLNYKTLQERIEMVSNALELSKQNLLTGIGGEGWAHRYKEVQSYDYTAERIHSYPAKVILEFGLLGIISYLGIMAILAIKTIKSRNINANTLAVLFAINIIMIHTILDTDMEYISLLMFTFGLMGVLSNSIERKNNKEIQLIDKIGNIVIVVIIALCIYLKIDTKIYNFYTSITNLGRSRNGLMVNSEEYLTINKKLAQEYEKTLLNERYDYILRYNSIVGYYMKSNVENKPEILEKYYEKIKAYENKSKNNVEYIMNKMQVVRNIIDNIQNINSSEYYQVTQKYINLILDEYEDTKKDLEVLSEKQYGSEESYIALSSLQSIYEYANKLGNNYLLGTKIRNESEIEIDKEELENIHIELGKNILIYHTHGTESYKSEEDYETYKYYKTKDENYNVIKIGKYFRQLLEEKGFDITYDIGYYDFPSTDGAYERSKQKVLEILKNKKIDLLIDVHRDALYDYEHTADTVNIEGEPTALLRFVVGIDENDEDWMYHLKLAIELQQIADKMYPNLFKPILIRNREYNQNIERYSILIEVGENCNMLNEALSAIECFSNVINEYYVNVNGDGSY